MFIQSCEAAIADKQSRQIMLECLFLIPPTRVQVERALCLVAHDISSTMERESLVCDLLLLLSSIMQRALCELSKEDGARLKEYLLMKAPSIHGLCLSGGLADVVQEGNTVTLFSALSLIIRAALCTLIEVSLDPSDEGDRTMVSSICLHWMECFAASIQSGQLQTVCDSTHHG